MYKILIVNDQTKGISEEDKNVKYVQLNNLKETLQKEEFDLIYLSNNLLNEETKSIILCDYMVLPKILEKLALNLQICSTFINIQILNKLIMDNTKIVEFENYYEELAVANIVKEKIIKKRKIKQIYKDLDLNKQEKYKLKKTVNSVILKNYTSGNFLRKCKYVLKKRKIQELFFNKIITNMENDILELKTYKVECNTK